ncbi:hypothetical protein Daudx_1371 [Candidatus Desulforudis audaxviator]|nr:hypothetical protein Daudx_1371 [Candidatus Desulforudis audaxviator]
MTARPQAIPLIIRGLKERGFGFAKTATSLAYAETVFVFLHPFFSWKTPLQ